MNKNKNLTIDEAFNLAVKNHQENNLQVAKTFYNEILKVNPYHLQALNNLATVFKKLRENQKAKDCFEKAIGIDPNYADAHYNLGNVFKELGERQKAKDCFEKVIKINPNYSAALNNLGIIFKELGEHQKAKKIFEKAIEINPDNVNINVNLSDSYIRTLDDLGKSMNLSYKTSEIFHSKLKFINQSVPLFRLKHDVQQAQYLISKDYELEGIKQFQKIGNKILNREEDKNNYDKKILLNQGEIDALLPFYKSDHIYEPKIISGSCINSNKNWQDVEDEYFNSSNQIIYIDDFLSEEAVIELQKFCLISKVWIKQFNNQYLGAFSNQGFISPIHLQIAIDLKQKLPKLFGPHLIEKFWGFKYDAVLGKGINIHADFAIHNLNFWITPDEYNNNKNAGGLKVYDVPAPENWTFEDYNNNKDKIYKYLDDNNTNCVNIPYKFNRAVLFNSAYFHETDEIDFKDKYEGRRINMTYLFGSRNYLEYTNSR